MTRCLESVVNQTIKPFEIIISDDGSSDDTVEVVRKFLRTRPHIPSEVLINPHRGPGATRNAGIRKAKGNWIALIDSDDAWRPEKLESVRKAIEAHPTANFIAHTEQHIRSDGTIRLLDYGFRKFNPDRPLPPQLYTENLFLTSSITCSRDLLLTHGLFDESLMSAQDYELWLRLSPHLRVHYIKDALGYYYHHERGITAGRVWPRWKNEMRVSWRHREKSNLARVAFRVGFITMVFLKNAVVKALSGR